MMAAVASLFVSTGALAQAGDMAGEPRIVEMANVFARGFFERDQAAPQSVIHPEISKIGIWPDFQGGGRQVTEELTPGKLWEIALTLNADGSIDPDTATVGVDFFDQTRNVGVIRLTADTSWYDFFLATRINDEWVFVNCAYGPYGYIENPDPDADMARITATARDYIDGYYAGDFDRVFSAVWRDFDRRHVVRGGRHEYLQPETLETLRFEMMDQAEAGRFDNAAPASVEVIGLTRLTGAVRIEADGWTEWLFLQRLNGDWQIVNSFHEAA
jgi:hypothetical protein